MSRAEPALAVTRKAAKRGTRLRPGLVRIGAWLALLVTWELYGRFGGVNPIMMTYPSAIAQAGTRLIANGELWRYAQSSLQVLTYGLLSGIVAGIPLGVLMARYRLVEWSLDTFVSALYAVPMVALVPLIVLWFGITLKAKVVVVGLFSVFPILLNTISGVKNVDDTLLEVARSFRSPEYRTWTDVIVPSALPFIVGGVRLAVGRSLVGMIVAEFYTSITGLGYMLTTYANAFATAKLFVVVVVIGLLGIGLTAALDLLERRLAPWKERS